MLIRSASASLLVLALLYAPRVCAESTYYAPPRCAGEELAPTPHGVDEDALLRCFAPGFLAPGTEEAHNRIGSPRVTRGRLWGTSVSVDPERPTLYGELRHDRVADRRVLQLVYRVHFEKIPLRVSRYFFEAHHNPGLLTLVTLDAATLEPLFVTTVHTCGCYRAVLPTQHVPVAWLPRDWPSQPGATRRVYGQDLPAVLDAPSAGGARIRSALLEHNHRVSDVVVTHQAPPATIRPLKLAPLESLRELPVEGSQTERASIFYTSGPLAGHVRGAWNAMEGLTLFGLVSLDPTVGMDKDFGHPSETGTRFYTMLRFWKHESSRLDRFDSLLGELGYRLSTDQAAAE